MRQKHFKIKNKTTGLFWNGYSNSFSENGTTFGTYDEAGSRLASQIKAKFDIHSWISQSEIVEYEVIIQEKQVHTPKHCVMQLRYHSYLEEQYGRAFFRAYRKVKADWDESDPHQYAIKIPRCDFDEFRASLKSLGFSSRHYKKVDEWIWVKNPDVVVRIKLLGASEEIIPIGKEEENFQSLVRNSDPWEIVRP